jgi:Gas vesicle synthesis protein GvpL/GvpF
MKRRHDPGPAVRLFCIVHDHSGTAPGMPGSVHLVQYRELSAVVEGVTAGRRGPGQPDLGLHRTVVAAFFARGSVVPAPPGIVFRRLHSLMNWLELHYALLTDALRYVDGRGEARLHIRCAGQDLDVRQDGHAAGPKSTRLDARALDIFHDLAQYAAAWTIVGRTPSLTAASTASDAVTAGGSGHVSRSDAPAATAQASERPRDVGDISASFLVDRSRWREFADAVAGEARRASGLELALSGPWPPYDFVRLEFGG